MHVKVALRSYPPKVFPKTANINHESRGEGATQTRLPLALPGTISQSEQCDAVCTNTSTQGPLIVLQLHLYVHKDAAYSQASGYRGW
jgi:hypothetical protein